MNMIEVLNLRVTALTPENETIEIVKSVSFTVKTGEVLALIGESGSGKTTVALSLLGYARPGCSIFGGSIKIDGVDFATLSERERRALRARKVAYVAQSASAAFNPARTLIDQVIEPALLHKLMSAEQARAKAVSLFKGLSLPSPETIGSRFPHQVSGGQLQRLMAAMALITDPAVVVFDEPTTALDVTTQIGVLSAFKKVIRDLGTTAVYVSHDLSVVAQMADRVVVLKNGKALENGLIADIIDAPGHDYTRQLISAAKRQNEPPAAVAPDEDTPLLELRGVSAGYGPVGSDGRPAVRVLDDVGFRIGRGRSLGIIGESGSGKTTIARVIAGLTHRSAGEVLLDGQPLPDKLTARSIEQCRRVQIVFQNADTALNPTSTIYDILARPMRLYDGIRGTDASKRVDELLDRVRLPSSIATRRPASLSGGQKQRVNLARALAANPALILCDEVTSALDVVVAEEILELLLELRRDLGLSYMFISHDISTVRAICDEVVVLYSGKCVESGAREILAQPPNHPYTHSLVDSVPLLKPGWLDSRTIPAQSSPDARSVVHEQNLCKFLPRCTARIDGKCERIPPVSRSSPSGATILCHHTYEELARIQARDTAAA
jgi:peptide/nickel transport system ATP-binding protein